MAGTLTLRLGLCLLAISRWLILWDIVVRDQRIRSFESTYACSHARDRETHIGVKAFHDSVSSTCIAVDTESIQILNVLSVRRNRGL